MAITFAARGDSFDALYSFSGKSAIHYATPGNTITAAADASAISGGNVWQCNTSNNTLRCLVWPGRNSMPATATFSFLIRVKPSYSGSPANNRALVTFVSGGNRGPYLELYHNTSGNLILHARNEASGQAFSSANVGAWSPTADVWYDIVGTWDGTLGTTAKVYVNASLSGEATALAAFTISDNKYWSDIVFATSTNTSAQWQGKGDELVVWDEIINPSSVGLVGGTGSLNGASRTAYVSVTAFDGSVWTSLTAAEIKSGSSQTQAGLTQTGSFSASCPNNTSPGVGNVRLDTTWIFNDVTLTGTLVAPTAISSTSGTVDIGNIKEIVRYVLDQANTTTGTPIDLSANLSTRVKSVMKVNPEVVRQDVNIYPYVTVFASRKAMQMKTIAATQDVGKRRADLTLTIVGCVYNDYSSDNNVDPADEDIEKLMENVERILRSYSTLGGYANWQFPNDVTYHSVPYDEETHMRVGVMDLQVSVYY